MQVKVNRGPIKNGNSHIENPTEIANEFNDFFVNIATKLKEMFPTLTMIN